MEAAVQKAQGARRGAGPVRAAPGAPGSPVSAASRAQSRRPATSLPGELASAEELLAVWSPLPTFINVYAAAVAPVVVLRSPFRRLDGFCRSWRGEER